VFFSFLYKTDINSDSAEKSEKRKLLESWLNKIMRIKISDGRTLIGSFLCTDQDRNIILGSCQEFVGSTGTVPLIYWIASFRDLISIFRSDFQLAEGR